MQYPHELSGGLRQRVMIAMAIICQPQLLIADEPTTALDVTIQAQIMELLKALQAELGLAILLITHDLGMVAEMCETIAVMYAGRIVEKGPTADIFARPRHPYTYGLLNSSPRRAKKGEKAGQHSGHCAAAGQQGHGLQLRRALPARPRALPRGNTGAHSGGNACSRLLEPRAMTPLLEARGLSKFFPSRDGKGLVRAVSEVSLTLAQGETLGIVGESGCGKSTLARMLMRLIEPSEGQVLFRGEDLLSLSRADMRKRRRDIQIVFQDPYASLDPRMNIAQIIAEPLEIHHIGTRAERAEKVKELLALVGLEPAAAARYPHEFSGGQRQRIGIARAIALEPSLVVLDEPVSALDVSIQSQILNLLDDLRARLNLSYIFISHDLSVVQHVSDRVAVMYLGRIVEEGTAEAVLGQPNHPYTKALISAVPEIDPRRRKTHTLLQGDPPNPEHIPPGCAFHPRCSLALDICKVQAPAFRTSGGSRAQCHLVEDTPDLEA